MAAARDPVTVLFRMREKLAAEFAAHSHVGAYLISNTAVIDRFVTACAKSASLSARCAVCAIGGYGRKEMFPYSDIDIAVLTPEDRTKEEERAISEFVTLLWQPGLTVGSAVRRKSEMLSACAADITAATAFLEARFLTGDKDLFEETYAAFREQLDSRMFFRSKMLEMRQRHQKYADTPYALEPNLKESPGGLRDLQVFLWYAKAADCGSSWREMGENGLITETEAFNLSQSRHFLRELRIRLHLLTGRHEDRLVFDLQTALAQDAGYKAKGALLASEALMKRYYLNAKNTQQLKDLLVASITEKIFPQPAPRQPRALDDVFVTRGDVLDISSREKFSADSANILRTFYLFATHRELKRISTTLLRALWHVRYSIDARFQNDERNKKLFMQAIKLRYGTYHFLKNLNAWGILGRFLPVWRRIVGQMQHDLFHVYTVDQHTIGAVKYLRRLTHSSYAHEYPLCSQIINEMSKTWRLTLAGLFHDIAKGREGNHSELGAKEVRIFAQNFGMNAEDTDYVEFLVREHLSMSAVAQKEDISNPDIVARFAKLVGTKERLDGLFLLSVCDIRATSPKVWNAWKYQLISDLYKSTRRLLEGESAPKTKASVFAEHRTKACELIAKTGIDEAVRDRLWKELDIVYFLRHTPQDIAWHAKELAATPEPDDALVKCRNLRRGADLEVLVYARDQKDLFARVVAYFEYEGLSILDARIHTTSHSWALDTFMVDDKRNRSDKEKLGEIVSKNLSKIIAEAKPLPEPRKGKLSRRSRCFPVAPIVDIERDESQKSWVLQITCNDRIGLLFAIAVVLARHNINLQTAKITTLDERVEDVFLIEGRALAEEELVIKIESELLDAVLNAA